MKITKNFFFQVIIKFILILNNKTVINFSYKDKILWLIYITMKNLEKKTWPS